MDLKVNGMKWMGNIYHKFEAVCQEVDDLVSQDAVKYLENQVQNVGDSVKFFYSEVVHELLPFPTFVSPTKCETQSVDMKNNFGSLVKSVGGVEAEDNNKSVDEENPIESLLDSNELKAGAPDKHELVNQVSGDEEVNPVNNFVESLQDSNAIDLADAPEKHELSGETCGVEKENLHASIEETSFKSTTELINLISAKEKEPLEFSIRGEENNMNSSTAQVLNFMPLDSSMVHECCESPQVAGQVMESNDGHVSSFCFQSMESNDEAPLHSIKSSLEDIQLNDDTKLEENSLFVLDRELYEISRRVQKLRSYKKRIQDAFTSKKRLAKEYEQLAIWYGDAGMESNQGLRRKPLFTSRTYVDSMNEETISEWELL